MSGTPHEDDPTPPYDDLSNGEDNPELATNFEQQLILLADERLQPFQHIPKLLRFVAHVAEAAHLDPSDPGDSYFLEEHIGFIRIFYPEITVSDEVLHDLIAQTHSRYTSPD